MMHRTIFRENRMSQTSMEVEESGIGTGTGTETETGTAPAPGKGDAFEEVRNVMCNNFFIYVKFYIQFKIYHHVFNNC